MSSPVVLITGALTGIGRATALAFAHEGARVVVSGRHDDEGSARGDCVHRQEFAAFQLGLTMFGPLEAYLNGDH